MAEVREALRPHDPLAPEQVAELISLVVPPGSKSSQRLEPLAALHGAVRSLSSELPILLEFDMRSPGEIHALEPLLPYVAALGVRFPNSRRCDPTRIGLLARLARRARKPLRFRIEPEERRVATSDWPETAASSARILARSCLQEDHEAIGFLIAGTGIVAAARAIAEELDREADTAGFPIFLELPPDPIEAAITAGSLLIDGIGDGLCIPQVLQATLTGPRGPIPVDSIGLAYAILQACRLRLTRAEFIACPSCGRTQFDLQTTTRRIQDKTAHLSGVKIAIMGCIVNGPGERADADFGYVGSGPGKVDLYVGKKRVRQALPAGDADRHLIELIKEHGMWADPPPRSA
jgi:hypothetical protein